MSTALRFLDFPDPCPYEPDEMAGSQKITVAVVDPDDEVRRTMVSSISGR